MSNQLNFSTFSELLCDRSNYNWPLFIMNNNAVDFESFYIMIRKTGNHIVAGNKYVISCNNPINYAVAFFSVIVYGGIAVLSEELALKYQFDLYIDDILIDKLQYLEEKEFPRVSSMESERVSIIVSSSGTTSKDKGIMLSQNNVCVDAQWASMSGIFSPVKRVLNILPYNHMFGIVADLMIPILLKFTICIPASKMFFVDSIIHYDVTHINAPPAILKILLTKIKKQGVKKVCGEKFVSVACAAAKAPEEMIREFEKNGVCFYTAYGMTECSPCVSISNLNKYNNKSAGSILGCNEVKIVDGEILIKGSNLMLGYYQDTVLTNKKIVNGWLYSGDYGEVIDGELYVYGRKDRLIVLEDGTKFNPEIIEAKLNKHELIKQSYIFLKHNVEKSELTLLLVSESPHKLILEARDFLQIAKNNITNAKFDKIICVSVSLSETSLGKVKTYDEREFELFIRNCKEVYEN